MAANHRILITGANGFVGRWLQNELRGRACGPDIEVITAGHGADLDRVLDIVDAEQVVSVVKETRPTAIVHLAAISAPVQAAKIPQHAWGVNFTGTMNVAFSALQHVPQSRFVFVSSSEVYGTAFNEAGGLPLSEDSPLKPTNVYGATKAAADIFIGQLAYEGLRTVRFRPFNHTGPGQLEAYVVSAFAKQIAEISVGLRPPTVKVGNLNAYRDFLDVRDVVGAYADAAMMSGEEADGRAFNLCSGRPVQVREVLDILVELSGVDVKIEIDPSRLRGSEIPRAYGSNEAAVGVLGWRPRYELHETLSDVLDDWKKRVIAARAQGSGD